MNDNPALAWLLWPLLTAICLLTILAGLRKVLKRTGWAAGRRQRILFSAAGGMLIWVVLLSVLAQRGFFADFSKLPPRPVLAILAPLPVILFIAFSKTGTELLKLALPQWLVLLQSFRIFVELLLWRAFLAGKVPVQMTFEGRNFDVLTGILALGAGYYISRRPQAGAGSRVSPGDGSPGGSQLKVALAFNIIGLLLLLNILVISALSMPTPIRYFMNAPASTLIAQFPFILLPGVLVPIAYGLHILSLRQIGLIRKNTGAPGS
ncbi:MAG TPA: hypothetical protein VE035_11060 [Puia sp.]|nr:hypothetical protein [Puia sp.]